MLASRSCTTSPSKPAQDLSDRTNEVKVAEGARFGMGMPVKPLGQPRAASRGPGQRHRLLRMRARWLLIGRLHGRKQRLLLFEAAGLNPASAEDHGRAADRVGSIRRASAHAADRPMPLAHEDTDALTIRDALEAVPDLLPQIGAHPTPAEVAHAAAMLVARAAAPLVAAAVEWAV